MGVAKLTEADGLEHRSTCPEAPRSAWPLQVGGDNASVVGCGEVFPAPLPRGEPGVGSAHGVGKTLGGRAVGENVLNGTHFKGFGLQGTEPALCSLALAVW